MMTSGSNVPERIKGNVKKSWKLQDLNPLLKKGRGMKLPGRFSATAPNEMMTSDSQEPEHFKLNVKKNWLLQHLQSLLQKGKDMNLLGRFSATAPNEMMTNDSQVPEHIKQNVKKNWILQHLQSLLQKGNDLWNSESPPITEAPYPPKSTALFFDYADTDTDRLAQISRFIGETPKLKQKVPLNIIIKTVQISVVVLLILLLIFQIAFWRCCHYQIKYNKRSLRYMSWR
ncbi:uncharacterized protein LOC120931175 [Rana temporaria]|uniref:uncharacterized protein LOC120931175 n=1 Tax=Rana temporaria TaxID=8407 RepID=UPI001AAD8514|nr:uncharacterized protein LOC120931175 [Rana temporaria]